MKMKNKDGFCHLRGPLSLNVCSNVNYSGKLVLFNY